MYLVSHCPPQCFTISCPLLCLLSCSRQSRRARTPALVATIFKEQAMLGHGWIQQTAGCQKGESPQAQSSGTRTHTHSDRRRMQNTDT